MTEDEFRRCTVAQTEQEKRLAALWRACEGIPTEALTAGVIQDMEAFTRSALWVLERGHNMGPKTRADNRIRLLQAARAVTAKFDPAPTTVRSKRVP